MQAEKLAVLFYHLMIQQITFCLLTLMLTYSVLKRVAKICSCSLQCFQRMEKLEFSKEL